MSFWKIYETKQSFENGYKIKEELIEIVQGNQGDIRRYLVIKYPTKGYLISPFRIPIITMESNTQLEQIKKNLHEQEKTDEKLRREIFGEHCC